MTYAATISKSGQVTLPSAIAKILGVRPGQRLIYAVASDGQTVTVTKEKSLEETLQDLDRIRTSAIQHNPTISDNIRRDREKSITEIRRDWDASPAGISYYQEKYGL